MANLTDCVALFKKGKQAMPAEWGLNSLLRDTMESEYNQVSNLYKNVSKNFDGSMTPVSSFNKMTKIIENDAAKKTAPDNKAAELIYDKCCNYFTKMGFPY